jgi:predicted nucleotidyltransferase
MDFSITRLADRLGAVAADVKGFKAAYLFGSAIRKANLADIDLVIVYEGPLTPATAGVLRPLVESAVHEVCGVRQVDLMLLSTSEAAEPGFFAALSPPTVFSASVKE